MTVSVVIPTYNGADFIAETLQSVLGQSLRPGEILVIDDGSTDNTVEIAESFGPPVRAIVRANARQASNRNFGVREARGEWIAFIDQDDLWKSNKIARQMEELQRTPHADICYTARQEFRIENGVKHMGYIVPVPPPERIREALFRNTTFMPSSVVIRRSTFLESGGFDPHFNNVEDWDLWLRLHHRKIVFAGCTEPLLLYRLHPNSGSHSALSSLRLLKEVYRQQVLPYLPRRTRWLAHMRSQSGQESAAAAALRRAGDPRDIQLMSISILRHPFHTPIRYKILAHMVYTRLKKFQYAKT